MRTCSWFWFCLLCTMVLAGCGQGSGAASTPSLTAKTTQPGGREVTIRVFAAASLADAFERLSQQFEEQNPGVQVELNFGGSQQLAYQINEGAPADVFASANPKQMEVVNQNHQLDAVGARVFAGNQLVVVLPRDNPARIQGMPDLARGGVKLVLAAREVPAGQYALELLDKASQDTTLGSGYKDAVLRNVISYEENVRSVLNKVSLGEADAGIVYSSDVAAGQEQVGQIVIPPNINVSAEYVMAVLKDSQEPDTARAFVNYVLSLEGQDVLTHYGFLSVK